MTNSNRIKLTWISFFSYALTGALVIVTGMVMGNIADYFQLPVSSMSNTNELYGHGADESDQQTQACYPN